MIQRDLNNSDSMYETEKTFETFLETRCTQVPRRMDVSRMDVWIDFSKTNHRVSIYTVFPIYHIFNSTFLIIFFFGLHASLSCFAFFFLCCKFMKSASCLRL
jgi:hypothetical protein